MCSHVGRCNRKSVVKLVFLYVVFLSSLPVLQGLALSDLYPFGKAASDNKTERTDDGGSHKILLKNPFKFFGRNKSSLFVSIPKCLGAFGVEYAITSARQNIWIKYTDWLDFGLSWLNRWFYSRYFNPTLLYFYYCGNIGNTSDLVTRQISAPYQLLADALPHRRPAVCFVWSSGFRKQRNFEDKWRQPQMDLKKPCSANKHTLLYLFS